MSLPFRPLTVKAGLPDLPLIGVASGIIAATVAPGIIVATVSRVRIAAIVALSIIALTLSRGRIAAILALSIIAAIVARGFIAPSLFLPTAHPRGAATAKEGPYNPGETPRECSMIII